ncbi:hypothetical protein yrohd0001_31800 [Yersinia rohdei ATCC 43380]|nr:hypothetical protein yrohd0001_31800 [Yersinia rohdei ATCC 43380]
MQPFRGSKSGKKYSYPVQWLTIPVENAPYHPPIIPALG